MPTTVPAAIALACLFTAAGVGFGLALQRMLLTGTIDDTTTGLLIAGSCFGGAATLASVTA